ncbi:MAG: hypothetical protein ACRCZI_05305, partial [Cetobacterium sp.]
MNECGEEKMMEQGIPNDHQETHHIELLRTPALGNAEEDMMEKGIPEFMMVDHKETHHIELLRTPSLGNVNVWASYDLGKVS